MSPSPPPIQIYAELLTNLRALSLLITLSTPSNRSTTATLSTNPSSLTITHDHHTSSIRLPSGLPGSSSTKLALPTTPQKSLSYRLQLQDQTRLDSNDEGNAVPWDSNALTGTTLHCSACENLLVHELQWRDLPSEQWAEMMDLWHCHKPPDGDGDGSAERRAYAAGQRFTVAEGVGFVSLGYVLVNGGDCSGAIQKSTSVSDNLPMNVQCAKCEHVVGVEDRSTDALKLSKWSLKVTKGAKTKGYATVKWFSAQLLSAIDAEGTRRFLIQEDIRKADGTGKAALLWVFTNDLAYSSSFDQEKRQDPTRAMKVFWKSIDEPEKVLKENQLNVEHVLLPANIYSRILGTLLSSRAVLPTASQTYQDWQVGLLERFTSLDCAISEPERQTLVMR
ncbi:hypothetical protein BT63DRAFT_15838 [Microthyrium microscopicum]|uniref:Ubiquitin-conjugating enzyme E2-binding protein n=1 Tax=Microthyrium microscopicum TaxID=703497 RepID=A0A6A6UU89_9PEZI|nr:hypothetical protein BT63DRAFT_15838 [Microthyrium microscopicum]